MMTPLHASSSEERSRAKAVGSTRSCFVLILLTASTLAYGCTRASVTRRPPATASARPPAGSSRPHAPSAPVGADKEQGAVGGKEADPKSPAASSKRHGAPARGPDELQRKVDSGDKATRLLVPIAREHRRHRWGDSFDEPRSGGRQHHAIDIVALRGAPVLAVDHGVIVQLSRRGLGGISLFQTDASGTFTFYYAHLDGYADGIHEGQTVQRGQILGYVGTTGNAPVSAPHLHFAVTARQAEGHWSKGKPVNPYSLLQSAEEP